MLKSRNGCPFLLELFMVIVAPIFRIGFNMFKWMAHVSSMKITNKNSLWIIRLLWNMEDPLYILGGSLLVAKI